MSNNRTPNWFDDSDSFSASSQDSMDIDTSDDQEQTRNPESSYYSNSPSSYYRSNDWYITRPQHLQFSNSNSDSTTQMPFQPSGWYDQAQSQAASQALTPKPNARRRLFETETKAETKQLTARIDDAFNSNQAMFKNPQAPTHQEENIFAELYQHATKLRYKIGNQCPHTSPVKKVMYKPTAYGQREIIAALHSAYDQKGVTAHNKDLLRVSVFNGNNYARMMNAARELLPIVAAPDNRFNQVFTNISVGTLPIHLATIRKNCNLLELIMIDSLCEKYPATDAKYIYAIFTHSKSGFYQRFRDTDHKLDKIALNKTALELYFSKSDLAHFSEHPTIYTKDHRGRQVATSFILGSNPHLIEECSSDETATPGHGLK